MSLLFTLFAFLLALGILVAIHEYGHYRMAVACGVKVLKFSIGFGPQLLRWQPKNQKNGQATEFVISALPLGGYVKMLNQRDPAQLPIAPADMAHEFNAQPAYKRFLIVAAGPIANLILAVLLYAGISWWGLHEPSPILAAPPAQSFAAQAGLRGGETVRQIAYVGEDWRTVRSLEDVRWLSVQGALYQRDVKLQLADGRTLTLPLSRAKSDGVLNQQFLDQIGIGRAWLPAIIGAVKADGPAARAGLKTGDLVLQINQAPVPDGMALLLAIQKDASAQGAVAQEWQVRRQAQVLQLQVQPRAEALSEQSPSFAGKTSGWVAKVDIGLQPPAFSTVRRGPLEGLQYGWQRTAEYSILTIKMLWRMATGQSSTKNLSGSFTIADMAGKSASFGPIAFIGFLAVLSVSLGVLNLLPIPLPALDGGYLVHYAWEMLTGKTVSESTFELLQRLGFVMIIGLMLVAHWNDLQRYFPQVNALFFNEQALIKSSDKSR